jgi:hypothetical protein
VTAPLDAPFEATTNVADVALQDSALLHLPVPDASNDAGGSTTVCMACAEKSCVTTLNQCSADSTCVNTIESVLSCAVDAGSQSGAITCVLNGDQNAPTDAVNLLDCVIQYCQAPCSTSTLLTGDGG